MRSWPSLTSSRLSKTLSKKSQSQPVRRHAIMAQPSENTRETHATRKMSTELATQKRHSLGYGLGFILAG
ncbi:hypothetical protein RB213_004376 [Colletotrichum asianum]